MRQASLDFLKRLLEAPSPSGYEGPVREVYRAEASGYADCVTTDVHGNVIAALNEQGRPRIMLAGHCDELGFQVVHVDDKGFIYFQTVGGVDPGPIPGRKVRIHTSKGAVLGVIGKKLIHLMTSEERDKVPKVHEMWIDIGARSRKEALSVVSIGDPITYDPNFEVLRKDLAVSKGFDNKMGVFVVAEAMRIVAEERRRLKAALFSVATVQEEVGLRGARTSAYGVDPAVGIAVDVTWATDHPDIDSRQAGRMEVGKGPVLVRGANVNPVVYDLLVAAAKRAKIPYQVEAASGGTGTDANAMQLTRAGVATAIVSVPLRYMHTPVELLSLKDLEQAARLIAAFVLRVDERTSFIP